LIPRRAREILGIGGQPIMSVSRITAAAFGIVALSALIVAHAQQPTIPTVSVITAEKRPVTESVRFVGRIQAIERVDIRARVTGYLEEVLFKDGDLVKIGTPLYRIEKGPFEAAVEQAQAARLRAQAQLDNAALQLQRAEELVKTSATSIAVRDDRLAARKAAQGDLTASEAALRTAEINLAYTDINSPIDGRIGRTAVTRGNVVGPDSGVLTTIVSSNPMYVTFPVSQREFIRIFPPGEDRQTAIDNSKVVVQISNGPVYQHAGKIDFVDVKVDQATDTVAMRATLPNPDGRLVDGQLVQVSVEGDKPEERIVVPQAALIADQQGIYVFVIEDGKAAIRRVKVGQTVGGSIVITEGLNGGELVATTGLQGLRPGLPVMAVPAEKPIGG
jgi:membrane fusion protein (multidrug efflux system)